MNRAPLLGVALGATLFVAARPARALGPVDVEAGVTAGGTTNLRPFGVNPFAVGAGVRAGVVADHVYGGVSFLAYLPMTLDLAGPGADTERGMTYGLEGGYGFTWGHFTLRPQLGIGDAAITGGSSTSHDLYLTPGALAAFRFSVVYFGADASAFLLPAGPSKSANATSSFDAAFTTHLQLGVTF